MKEQKKKKQKPQGPLDNKGMFGSDTFGSGTFGPTKAQIFEDARVGWGFEPGTQLERNEGAF